MFLVRIHRLLLTVALLPLVLECATAQSAGSAQFVPADSDRDGMSDELEQALLLQFRPAFMVGAEDCSKVPAEFRPGIGTPIVEQEDGTIYGQVTPDSNSTPEHPTAEIHFYHLWKSDCGSHGHPLDTEHVAVLVQASSGDLTSAHWRAVYWYAAAHEATVCDVSQIARAATLGPDDRGVPVWISPGKHASYLNASLCQSGCGADRCDRMVPLPPGKIINLGELDHPMNGSAFISSSSWPLAQKMENSNFPADSLARLNQLPATDIAWFNAGRHPAQGVIAISSSTEQVIAGAGHNTTAAISLADGSTGNALATASGSTGNALQKSYRRTVHFLGASGRAVGRVLPGKHKADPVQ